MNKTSFGTLEILKKQNNHILCEYLVFEKEGRGHKHKNHESFLVTKGEGEIFVEETSFKVSPGSLVTIPPNSSHWMKPTSPGSPLEGLLFYHDNPLKKLN